MDDVTLVGTDDGGYKVYQHRDGRVIGGHDSLEEATRVFESAPGQGFRDLEEYAERFGFHPKEY